jgi:hypothetical protein
MRVIDILSQDNEFSLHLYSLYWPFTEGEIKAYWDVLKRGSGHYTTAIYDEGRVISASVGLSFNRNVHWTPALQTLWKCGIVDHYNGYITGLGAPIEFEDAMSLECPLPLSVFEEIEARRRYALEFGLDWAEQGFLQEVGCPIGDEQSFRMSIPRLSLDSFERLFRESPDVILYNPSIWNNTLSFEVSHEDVLRIVTTELLRNQMENGIGAEISEQADESVEEPRENCQIVKIEALQQCAANPEEDVEEDDQSDYEDDYYDDDAIDPMDPASDPAENPWIEVFGNTEEARMAYWNTQ